MDKYISVISAIGGLAFGALGGYLNGLLSRRSAKNKPDSVLAIMGTNALRFAVDGVFLLAGFLACKLFELPYFITMIAVAVGLSTCGLLMLLRLTKQIKADDLDGKQNGGE